MIEKISNKLSRAASFYILLFSFLAFAQNPVVAGDVGVTEIISPPLSAPEDSYPIAIEITNFGTEAQVFDIYFEVYRKNSYPPDPPLLLNFADTLTGYAQAGPSVDTVTFNSTFESYLFNYLKAYTSLQDDEVIWNDTAFSFSSAVNHVAFRYGNPDGTPVNAYIGETLELDIYFQTFSEQWVAENFMLTTASSNQYIDSFLIQETVFHYPLTGWDSYYAEGPFGSPPNFEGWSGMLVHGFNEMAPPCDSEPLWFLEPEKVLTFKIQINDDLSLVGTTAYSIGIGCGPYGFSNAGNSSGGYGFEVYQFFSPVHFVERTGYEYLPNDANMANGIWPPQKIGSDVTYLVNYFRSLQPPCNLDGFYASADINGDCLVIGSDVTRLVGCFRGLCPTNWCLDYPPAWPHPDSLPPEAPSGWPNCEPE
ncbi:MAG: hypothetical protein GY839_07945 [candidate division Zixibacteria bacterium]|nr:hypothetical protein [candidate division Zixibacteria bacterium]